MAENDIKKPGVLLVDDDYVNLQVLLGILDKDRYNITAALNAEETFAILKSDIPDIILLDVMMPQIDGYEVCRKLKSDERYKHIPVIFITALDDAENIVKGFNLGASDYITKPFNADVVLARVQTHLNLKFRTEKLETLNNKLEEKVKDRTRELQAANEKLTELDEQKIEFLQIISHEIRTPLNGIMGATQMAQNRCGEPKVDRMFVLLNESVKRLENFTLNALLITQLKTKKDMVDKHEVSLVDLVSGVENKFEESIGEKRVLLASNIETETVWADEELLKKAVEEIVENALKYSPEDSVITVSAYVNGSQTIIEIADQGPGFSEKSLRSLFTLFSPGEKHIDKNAGIDLALCKLIMDALNGNIVVHNSHSGAVVQLILN